MLTINKHKPEKWQGTHILLCKHCFGDEHCREYAMYCNLYHDTSYGRVKVEVFGDRWRNVKKMKIRYVDKERVKLYQDYFKD